MRNKSLTRGQQLLNKHRNSFLTKTTYWFTCWLEQSEALKAHQSAWKMTSNNETRLIPSPKKSWSSFVKKNILAIPCNLQNHLIKIDFKFFSYFFVIFLADEYTSTYSYLIERGRLRDALHYCRGTRKRVLRRFKLCADMHAHVWNLVRSASMHVSSYLSFSILSLPIEIITF